MQALNKYENIEKQIIEKNGLDCQIHPQLFRIARQFSEGILTLKELRKLLGYIEDCRSKRLLLREIAPSYLQPCRFGKITNIKCVNLQTGWVCEFFNFGEQSILEYFKRADRYERKQGSLSR